jgi:hypothetical protein
MSEACTGQLDGKYGSTAFCWYVDFGVRTTDACVTVHHSQPLQIRRQV